MAYGEFQASNDHIPDLGEILQILRRHKKLIMGIMAGGLAAGIVLALVIPNSYRATATVVLNDHNLNLNDFQDLNAGAKFDEMTVQTETNILNSPALALQTIKATGLDKNPEFASSDNDEQEVVASFLKHLSVESQGTSRAIDVSFKSHDPELSARVANALVRTYLESQVDYKNQQAEELSKWFEARVKDLKADVIKKSQAVAAYRAKENIVVGKDDEELIYQQISDVASQLVPVEVHKYDMQSRDEALNSVAKTGAPDAVDDIVKSPLIQGLKAQASTIMQELGSLKAKYGPNHPRVIEAEGELRQVNRAIASEESAIKHSMRNDHDATAVQEAMLKKRLVALNKQADALREKMITLTSLQVEADASQKILDNFLKSYENVQSQVNFGRPDAFLASPAVAPVNPAFPGKKLILAIVLAFSFCLSMGIVFVLETLRQGVRNFDDVRRLSQKPLGILPLVPNPAYAMLDSEGSSYKESVKRIYMTGIMNNPARTILVTSALPKEGRTTFVTSMAHYLRSLDHRVIVIDADFLKPSLSQSTSMPDGPGFTDVLTGRATLAEAVDSDENGLPILRAGSQAAASPQALQSVRLHELLEQLKLDYAYILIDSGPLLAHSEAGVIAMHAEGIIVVTEWIKTSRESIANMFATLRHFMTPIMGVVINKVDIGKYKALSSGSDFLLPRQVMLPKVA